MVLLYMFEKEITNEILENVKMIICFLMPRPSSLREPLMEGRTG